MMYRDAIIFIQGTLWNWTIPEVSKRQKIQELLWMFKRTPAQLDCLHLGHSTTGHRSVSTTFWDTVPIRSYPHREDNKVPSSKRIKTQHVSVIPFPSIYSCSSHGARIQRKAVLFHVQSLRTWSKIRSWLLKSSKMFQVSSPVQSYFILFQQSDWILGYPWVHQGFIQEGLRKPSPETPTAGAVAVVQLAHQTWLQKPWDPWVLC